ncbi:11406_t:CDS:2 [Funneliformis geosporum]|nr:11406_t:CDS:2 [Funneliformis geosporum]
MFYIYNISNGFLFHLSPYNPLLPIIPLKIELREIITLIGLLDKELYRKI